MFIEVNHSKNGYRYGIASLLSGAAMTLAFSPFDYWFLLIPILCFCYHLMQTTSVRQAIFRGSFFGLGFYSAGISWVYVSIHFYGGTGAFLAALMTLAFVIFLTVLFTLPQFIAFHYLNQKCNAWQKIFLFASVWVIFEWLRSWLLTGFPWLYVGYTLIDTPLVNWAPIVGIFGLSFIYTLTCAALVGFLSKKHKRNYVPLLLSIGLIASSYFLGTLQWTEKVKDSEISYSAVQGNIPQDMRWKYKHLSEIISKYEGMTSDLWQQDLVIWPENSIPSFQTSLWPLLQELSNQSKRTNTSLLLGLPWTEGKRYYNGILSLNGDQARVYKKQKLVPFGEYLPFESTLRGLINFFKLPMSSFSRGKDAQEKFDILNNKITTLICYEIVYPDFVAKQALNSNLLVTISNDGWFDHSLGPYQHFQMARMRAIETGRYLLRVTNNGITALVNPKGVVVKSLPQYTSGVLSGELSGMSGDTPFMILGSYPIILLCFMFVLVFTLPYSLAYLRLRTLKNIYNEILSIQRNP